MNIMRSSYKKLAEIHSEAMCKHMGQLVDDVWEVVRICSQAIDHCLRMDGVLNNEKLISMLLILRNMVSDCCCCMDALERGHERTIFNNIRMILEDLSCVVHAKENSRVLETLLAGDYQASNSISFLRDKYPTHELHKIYGLLSKLSHHKMQELVVRQWVNRDGLLSHLKPFDPNRKQAKLNALLMVTHLVRLAGEVAESLCFNELDQSYFWVDPITQKKNLPVDEIIGEIATSIATLMRVSKFPSPADESAVAGSVL